MPDVYPLLPYGSKTYNANWQPQQSPSSADLVALVEALQAQVNELKESNRQIQAMVFEMWSGQSSDVIITPPSTPRSEDILRLNS